ncbi:AAA family ATPase [Salana multivorans]
MRSHPRPGTGELGGRALLEHARPHEVLGVDLGSVQMHPGRTVRDHLALVGHGVPGASDRIADLAAALGIDHYADRRPNALSTGMRRAVALVAALACDPAVLLLDEPMNGLEIEKARIVRTLLREHAERGGTVLLSSHILAGAELLADRVVLIEGGGVRADTTLDEFVLSRGGGGVQVVVDDPHELLLELGRRGILARLEGESVVADTADTRVVSEAASAIGVLVLQLGRRRASLEDAVLEPGGSAGQEASRCSRRAGQEQVRRRWRCRDERRGLRVVLGADDPLGADRHPPRGDPQRARGGRPRAAHEGGGQHRDDVDRLPGPCGPAQHRAARGRPHGRGHDRRLGHLARARRRADPA